MENDTIKELLKHQADISLWESFKALETSTIIAFIIASIIMCGIIIIGIVTMKRARYCNVNIISHIIAYVILTTIAFTCFSYLGACYNIDNVRKENIKTIVDTALENDIFLEITEHYIIYDDVAYKHCIKYIYEIVAINDKGMIIPTHK